MARFPKVTTGGSAALADSAAMPAPHGEHRATERENATDVRGAHVIFLYVIVHSWAGLLDVQR